MRSANFTIVHRESTPDRLVIRDEGPWDRHPTVTNDAENVVASLVADGYLPPGRKLLYYDSDGRLDQLLVRDGRFAGFAPWEG